VVSVAAAEPDSGAKVIRAHVRARLLGLPLLTIDARIDVSPPDRGAAELSEGRTSRDHRWHHRRDGERLSRAALLLEEGGQSLGEAQALRRRLVSVMPGDAGSGRAP
jgi:hypothetical protein